MTSERTVTNERTVICGTPNCFAADGLSGYRDEYTPVPTCPNIQHIEATEPDVRAATIPPWSGLPLGEVDAEAIVGTGQPRLVALVGLSGSGKTTALAAFWTLLRRGHRRARHDFAGSYTLLGWHAFARHMAWHPEGRRQFPPHTTATGEREPALLHTALKRVDSVYTCCSPICRVSGSASGHSTGTLSRERTGSRVKPTSSCSCPTARHSAVRGVAPLELNTTRSRRGLRRRQMAAQCCRCARKRTFHSPMRWKRAYPRWKPRGSGAPLRRCQSMASMVAVTRASIPLMLLSIWRQHLSRCPLQQEQKPETHSWTSQHRYDGQASDGCSNARWCKHRKIDLPCAVVRSHGPTGHSQRACGSQADQ